MSLVCRAYLRHQFKTLPPLRPLIAARRYAASLETSTTPPVEPENFKSHIQSKLVEPEQFNSFSLRNKVEHLLRMQHPEEAEDLLKKTDIDGEGTAFSWNLCIRYYAKKGDNAKCERLYQQVTT